MSLSKFATMEDYYKHRSDELEKQNAELLEALKLLVAKFDREATLYRMMNAEEKEQPEAIIQARALIAKHGGGV